MRRQYSSPNCKLILEGLSNDIASENLLDGIPLMSILINSECHFVGSDQVMSGGRDFFESLVKAVSAYAQEFLSGLEHPTENVSDSDWVLLEKVKGKNLHRLIWQSLDNNNQTCAMDLTTVQLFDLVETVDQFFADARTLPEIKWTVQPVSRRYRQTDEPLVERATPLAFGLASLALTGIALFFVPIPEEVKDPNREPLPQSNPSETQSIPSEPPNSSNP
ncbi:MAG: DUF4335 domain-containing protein [Gomphosphaeria aponina SAG 52.96 = DSM 107014]|uniref:DUF4335 domain-containing protein n=1 Tax=Gomphosphaeria aponina SAG 52.96 = DSM 107014 TaxID=1521640 RepID=A0A941GT81_9CHRO|nr:DUF4335 domain-containing protein [Gomphosphaeria aponina SAG 52.96 = DSM 107014]